MTDLSGANRANLASKFFDIVRDEYAALFFKGTAHSHVAGGGDEGNTAVQVRTLPQERRLGQDLQSAGGGEDRLGGSDGGAKGEQR